MPAPRQGLRAWPAAVAIGWAFCAQPVDAIAAPIAFRIPAQDLAGALRQAALQSGTQIAFNPAPAVFRRTVALSGSYEFDAALARLLRGAGLTYRRDANGTVLIVQQTAPRAEPRPESRIVRLPLVQERSLDEIIVTAGKQLSPLGSLPMSIYALSQPALDREGLRTIQDLAAISPGLTVRRGTDNSPSIAIRGIASTAGGPTIGVYLDDIPLQKRNVQAVVNGNGSPIPQIFDLERIEILHGPQGALYGGSAEGGMIRFITPQPSLKTYSANVFTRLAATWAGSPSRQVGAVVGVPLIRDRLGIRISAWTAHTGGYVDHVSRLTGQVLEKDSNSSDSNALRVAALLAASDNLTVLASVYSAQDNSRDWDVYWRDIQAYTVPARSYDARGVQVAAGDPAAVFTRAAHTYGPFAFGAYRTGLNTNVGETYAGQIQETPQNTPRKTLLFAPSVTLDWKSQAFEVKAITSYVYDRAKGLTAATYVEPLTFSGSPFVFDLPQYVDNYHFQNRRTAFTEELRASSPPGSRGPRWLMGMFYSRSQVSLHSENVWNVDQLIPVVRGVTDVAYYGAPLLPGGVSTVKNQTIKEEEIAAFGEIEARLTSRLKATVGLRASSNTVAMAQVSYGQTSGFLRPTAANNGLVAGSKSESSMSPKFSLAYELTDRGLLYFNAAKGFRIGGVNPPVSPIKCKDDLQALGRASTPTTYDADSLWNYELGAKVRGLDGRLQINGSLFYIDWRNVQINASLPTCGFAYVVNGPGAVSKGFDLAVQSRPWRGLKLAGQVAYTDARYTETLLSPPSLSAAAPPVVVRKGDDLGTPRWTFTMSGEYSHELGPGYEGYVSVAYNYSGPYHSTFGPGAITYAPDTRRIGATHLTTLRTGVNFGGWTASAFVDNLFNSKDILQLTGGRRGCADAACASPAITDPVFVATSLRPRTAGVELRYRY